MPAMILLIYMALISAVAYTLWGILLKYNPVSKVSIFGFTNPVFGVILSAIILREGNVFGMKDLIALVLVSIGILIVNWVVTPVHFIFTIMNMNVTRVTETWMRMR